MTDCCCCLIKNTAPIKSNLHLRFPERTPRSHFTEMVIKRLRRPQAGQFFMSHTWNTFTHREKRPSERQQQHHKKKISRRKYVWKLSYETASTCVARFKLRSFFLLPHFYASCYNFFRNFFASPLMPEESELEMKENNFVALRERSKIWKFRLSLIEAVRRAGKKGNNRNSHSNQIKSPVWWIH